MLFGCVVFLGVILFTQQDIPPLVTDTQDVVLAKIDFPIVVYADSNDLARVASTSGTTTKISTASVGLPLPSQPKITARAVFIKDLQSGTQLYSYNSDEPRHPASVTKLMTALVARESYYLDQVLETSLPHKALGTIISFFGGETQTVRSLLKATLIQSGNDAAEILAERHPEGYDVFIKKMNEKAREIGLHHSQLTNPSGLDDLAHLMSAQDITQVFEQVLTDVFLRETLSESRIDIFDSSGGIKRTLFSTNQLLPAEFVVAGKTGTTELAGQVLTSLVIVDGHEVIITVMGSQDRYADTISLYEWIQKTYNWVDASELNLVHYM